MYISRRIYEDIVGLKVMGLDGYVEDGSQRSFFPNGFHMYIYAETLMNRECDFDAVLEDYFSHIYGDAWTEVKAYLQKVSDIFDFGFMSGEKAAEPAKGPHYDPAKAEVFESVKELAAQGRAIAEKHLAMPTRPQTVSIRMLLRHAEYIEGFAAFMQEKALGNNDGAFEKSKAFCRAFGKYEFELERYFDHGLAFTTLMRIVTQFRDIFVEGA